MIKIFYIIGVNLMIAGIAIYKEDHVEDFAFVDTELVPQEDPGGARGHLISVHPIKFSLTGENGQNLLNAVQLLVSCVQDNQPINEVLQALQALKETSETSFELVLCEVFRAGRDSLRS